MQWKKTTKFMNKDDGAANAQAQTNYYNTLTANYNADYGEFEGQTKTLMDQLQTTLSAGPGQYGFDPTEDAAIRSSAINADAAAGENAEVAANQQITASNGGASLTPTGAQEQLKEEGDVSSAQKLATDENTITQEGYQAGTQKYDTALGGATSVLGLENPNSFASAATGAGSDATSAIQTNINASDSWMNMVGGALGGVTGALTAKAIK